MCRAPEPHSASKALPSGKLGCLRAFHQERTCQAPGNWCSNRGGGRACAPEPAGDAQLGSRCGGQDGMVSAGAPVGLRVQLGPGRPWEGSGSGKSS